MDDSAKPVVLIIDDDEANRELIGILLKRENIEPVLAEDGGRGIEMALSRNPHLILLDFFMPMEDGFEILRRIKTEPALKDIPVIIFTILEREESKQEAFELGAADYVTKPFDMKEIIYHIRKYLPNENR